MTTLSRRARWMAPPVAIALAAGLLGALAAPAPAAKTNFRQNTDDLVGSSVEVANSVPIAIPAFGVAKTYPSKIAVTHTGTIADLEVTLFDVEDDFPEDIDIMLVGPGGQEQQVTLMSGAGGGADLGEELEGDDLTFDDEAVSNLPHGTDIAAGTFKPTSYEDNAFTEPAPPTNQNTLLSVFDGTLATGTWQLFVLDDAAGADDPGQIAGGWSLKFTWVDTQSPPDPSVDTHAPSGTVNVNGGAATTHSPAVTLNVTATDPAPASGVTQMRFSNDGTSFSAYQPFAATAAWTLAVGAGVKTVYAQFRDLAGNVSAVSSDTITLHTTTVELSEADTTGPKAVKVTPVKNAKHVRTNTKVKVKASEKLTKGSLTKKTVYLKEKGVSGKVKAKVKYIAASKTIVLTPTRALDANTTFKVTVKGVKDLAGNKWDQKPKKSGTQALKYSFTTG